MNLLIVESPTKAKTLAKFLNKDFRIMASVGHIRDLPKNKLGVDTENNFQPEYTTIKGKTKILNELKKASKTADAIYLAPDPDREGEAIAWHIAQELKKEDKKIHRILFNEFTDRAIKKALSDPKGLNQDRFESQQARRILDRLVGYRISPLLWSKVKRGLSAGRVQSVALRMICDREREIHAFDPVEYWSLTAHLQADDPPNFKARLFKYDGAKVELKDEQSTRRIMEEVKDKLFIVESISKKKKKKNPLPPFTTSLLQQEAYKKLRFPAKKTMMIAQNLYEGIELGSKGQIGLITYMRTDSFRLSNEALSEAREFIGNQFGTNYLPEKANTYKSRKGAQEAHEAIRPTSVHHHPDQIRAFLTKDQLSLYWLIWRRFLASQMTPALLEQTQADITAGKAVFRASGSVILFNGFTAIYEEEGVEPGAPNDTDALLPILRKDQNLTLEKLEPAQHFTQPPPRFSEATLIKALEENGIGRPSTYASILSNIRGREYVTIDKGRFRPTELGFLVTDLLVKSFPEIFNIAFTARMETNLDKIEKGQIDWTKVLEKFHRPFKKDLEKAQKDMRGAVPTPIPCPDCGKLLTIKSGRNGLFLGCSGYPDCRYTANFSRNDKGQIVPETGPDVSEYEGTCDKCGKPMVVKRSKFGLFLACSGFPKCKNTSPLNQNSTPESTDVPCPQEGCQGTLVARFSKKGKKFFACNQYPSCRFVLWNEPVDQSCPICGTPILEVRHLKKTGPALKCRKRGCTFSKPLETSGDGLRGDGPA